MTMSLFYSVYILPRTYDLSYVSQFWLMIVKDFWLDIDSSVDSHIFYVYINSGTDLASCLLECLN